MPADNQLKNNGIFIGNATAPSASPVYLNLGYATQHGLVTGAKGSGKAHVLQILAEGFSDAGVPVLATDVTGQLLNVADRSKGYPCAIWDVIGGQGEAIQTFGERTQLGKRVHISVH